MTQKEKIHLLKSTIQLLYEKEGRSKSYIARLLNVDRKTLINEMKQWSFIQANTSYLSPSNQKFLNKHKQLLLSRFQNDVPLSTVAKELHVSKDYLSNIVKKDPDVSSVFQSYLLRKEEKARKNREETMKNSSREYIEDLPNEIWKPILGYEEYFVSNMGRIKKLAKRYQAYFLIKPNINVKSGRYYVKLRDKNLSVSRLVAHAFVDGYSETNNTVHHKDEDVTNNRANNLEWVSQSENNRKKSKNHNIAYSKTGKFKLIRVDDKYEFKTIRAFAKFLGISETQASRYIHNESKHSHKIEIIY